MSFRYTLLEPVRKGLKRYLTEYLPAKLSSISAEIGDQLPLPTPRTDLIFTEDRAVIADFPSIEIIPGRGRFSRLLSNTEEKDAVYSLSLMITQVGMDEEQIVDQLDRYLRAIDELLTEMTQDPDGLLRPFLGPYALDIWSEEFMHLYREGSGGGLIRAVQLIISTQVREGRGG
jgi:hypothetical protein